ncbi:hypothetical protein [Haloarcula litorea]|uniref:hypothetical protein n=1 Tax=Haloarcula litorea TaxID=3032579 RepID=UPI0023E8D186|nr:hypothetical protein [Halomicroarcula sp. GDY20]
MAETTQVNVKVPVSMKQDWEEYIEEHEEATSLSHLIRLSVQREVSDERGANVDIDPEDVELDVDVDFTQLESKIDNIDSKLDELRSAVHSLEAAELTDTEDVQEIADKIYDTMPRRSAETESRERDLSPREIAQMKIIEDVEMRMDRGQSLKDFAEQENFYGLVEAYKLYFEADDYTMQRALERVQEYSSRVHVVNDLEYKVVFEQE